MDDDSKAKIENALESLEFELLKDLTTDEDDTKLLEQNVTSCTEYMYYGYGDIESKKNIRNNYLKKLQIGIERLNGIDVTVKCKDFRTDEENNKAIVTFDNINKSSITYNTKLNETIIKWSILDAQKQSFVYMNNPLICLLGISEFKGLTCTNIVGAKYDMIALRRLFEDLYGFKVSHQNDRMIWTREQIKDFFDSCIQEVLNCQGWEEDYPKLSMNDKLNGLYDGIIVVISTHGGENEVIFDSYEKPYNLHKIYQQFGSNYPALLKIPRIFVVDACRGTTSNQKAVYSDHEQATNSGAGNASGSKSIINDWKEKEKDVIVHKGSNRVTLFGNSPGFTTSFTYEEDSQFGCSFFIRSIIDIFGEYETNKTELYTPTLSDILSTVKYKLGLLTDEKQIPYKNGDVRLDKLKILKKKVFNNRVNDKYDPKWAGLDNKKYLHEFSRGPALVRWYKYKKSKSENNEGIVDTSKLSVDTINGKLEGNEIQEQFPKRCQINDFAVIPDTNGEILYIVQPNNENMTMKVKLSSLICCIETTYIEQQEEIFRQKQYGLIQQAMSHRFIELEISNNCEKFNLSLFLTNCYFEECEFVDENADVVSNDVIFSNGGIQTSFIVGNKLQKDDPFYYNNLCENGVVCVLKYTIRSKHDNKLRGGKKGKNNLIIAIRSTETTNKLKNLAKPMYNCWLCTKKQCKKGEMVKSFLNRLNDNIYNYKSHSYITLQYDANFDRSYWKISFIVDVDVSETSHYDSQNALLLVFGFLRFNGVISDVFDDSIFKCICSYFSVNNIYAIGFNSLGVFGIGNRTSFDMYTNLLSMSSLIHLAINIDLFVIHDTRTYIQSTNDGLYVCGGNELNNLGIGEMDESVISMSMLKKMNVSASVMSCGIRAQRTFFVDVMNENILYSFGYFDRKNRKFVKIPTPLYNINETFNSSKLIQIECGEKHSVFLSVDGNVWTMGSNKEGECGQPKPQKKNQILILVPTIINNLQCVTIKKLAVGGHHNLCLDNKNNVWSFGRNKQGQLATRNNEKQIYEATINFIPDINEKIIDVVCGDSHSLYLMSNNTVYLFGDNHCAQIGNGTHGNIQNTPQHHKEIFIQSASLGCRHTVLLSTQNFLWTFGSNTHHQCSTYCDELLINKPYKVTKMEMGLNHTDYIKRIFAGYENTLIVVEESLLKQSNNYYL